MSWTNQSKNSATWTNQTKSGEGTTWAEATYTWASATFTWASLADISWTNLSKS